MLGFGSLPCKAPLPCLRLRAGKAARGPPSKGREKHPQIPPLAVSLLLQDPLGAKRCKKKQELQQGRPGAKLNIPQEQLVANEGS